MKISKVLLLGPDITDTADKAAEMKKNFETSQQLEAMGSLSSTNLLERLSAEARGEAYNAEVMDSVAQLRKPQILSVNICSRLRENGIDSGSWLIASTDRRLEMLDDAVQIMAQEMMLPKYIQENLELGFIPGDAPDGASMILRKAASGAFSIDHTVKPTIFLDPNICGDTPLETALARLFTQSSQLMEQVVCTELPGSVLKAGDRADWEKAISKALDDGEQFAPDGLLKYAKKSEGTFLSTFRKYEKAMESNNTMPYGPSMGSSKAKSITARTSYRPSFTNSTDGGRLENAIFPDKDDPDAI